MRPFTSKILHAVALYLKFTASEAIGTVDNSQEDQRKDKQKDWPCSNLGPRTDAGRSVQTCHMAELFLAIVAYDAQETEPEAEFFCFLFPMLDDAA